VPRYLGSEDPKSPKKLREQRALAALQVLVPELFGKNFRIGTSGSEPDFVCDEASGPLGIEIVEYFSPEQIAGSPLTEQQYLADQVTSHATRVCKQLGLENVLAEVEFTFEERIRKHQVPYLARTIASVIRPVAAGIVQSQTWRGRHLLPPTIAEVWACRRDNIPAPFVGHSWGGTVEAADLDFVQQIIAGKEDKLSIYQSCCSRLWLALIVDPYHVASMAYVPKTFRIKQSKFERVLVLQGWSYTIDILSDAA